MNNQLPNKNSSIKGFTLIELLVVVAIIAILAVIGAAIFSGVQQKARDARRQSDVLAIAKAYEANRASDATTYPVIATTWFASGAIPSDSYTTVKYSTAYVTQVGCKVTLSAAGSRTWATTSANPSPASFTITGTCSPATAATVASSDAVTAAMTSFQVCALLETGTAPNFYCVANAQ